VTSSRCDLERPLDAEVAAHLREVMILIWLLIENVRRIDRFLLRAPVPSEKLIELSDLLNSYDFQVCDERSLCDVATREHEPAIAGSSRGIGNYQGAAHGPYRTIQAELATDGVARQQVVLDLTTCGQDSGSQGQIEAGTTLAQVCGRQIYRDTSKWKLESAVEKRCANSLTRFLDCRIWKADDRERWETGLDIRLHRDLCRIDAQKGKAGRCSEHSPKLGGDR
jgi:hypothetical protein